MESYTLREKPLIEISISENFFVLNNESDSQKGGKYEFSKIDSIRLDRRINWLVSIFGFVVSIFMNASSDLYKERDVMKFNYGKKPLAISLKSCDLELALKAINDLNQRIVNR